MSAAAPETRLIAGRQWRVKNGVLQMHDANLRGVNLEGADLRGVNLCGADLRGVNLCDANLREANLWGANLEDANLWGANLWGANLPLRFVHIAGSGARLNWAWITDNGAEVHMGCHSGARAFGSFDDAKAHYRRDGYCGERREHVEEMILNLETAERVCELRRAMIEA